jgi:hypothetical protein
VLSVAEMTVIWNRMLEHAQMAEEASRKYTKRKTWLAEYMKVNAVNYKTDFQRRSKLTGDWALSDALDAYKFHSGEQQRLGALLVANEAFDSAARRAATTRPIFSTEVRRRDEDK